MRSFRDITCHNVSSSQVPGLSVHRALSQITNAAATHKRATTSKTLPCFSFTHTATNHQKKLPPEQGLLLSRNRHEVHHLRHPLVKRHLSSHRRRVYGALSQTKFPRSKCITSPRRDLQCQPIMPAQRLLLKVRTLRTDGRLLRVRLRKRLSNPTTTEVQQ